MLIRKVANRDFFLLVVKRDKKKNKTYGYENVQKVLQRRQLRDELLYDFTEGLEYGVVVDAGQVEAEERKQKRRVKTLQSYSGSHTLKFLWVGLVSVDAVLMHHMRQ